MLVNVLMTQFMWKSIGSNLLATPIFDQSEYKETEDQHFHIVTLQLLDFED